MNTFNTHIRGRTVEWTGSSGEGCDRCCASSRRGPVLEARLPTIAAGQTYFISNVGTTVIPAFQGGTLQVDTNGKTYAGTLYQTRGPAWNAVPFDPQDVVQTPVGTASVTFADGNTGAFSYNVNGIAQTKVITREVLRAPGTVCQ